MRSTLTSLASIAGVAAAVTLFSSLRSQSELKAQAAATAQPEKPAAQAPAPNRAADEAAIRANVAAFVQAFNAKNAKAIAALFVPEGQIVSKDGDVSEGRAAIEQTFADLFADEPQKRTEVSIESLRFIGPDLAIEEGSSKETSGPGEPPEYDRYTVIHVKRDGKWMMAMARDEEGPPPTPHEQLKLLAWLVGDWVDDGGSVVVKSNCRWSDDGNFLLQDFNMQVSGENAMRVNQRIGWDPLSKRVHSWVFDSEGGYGESVWTQDGTSWIIKATGVRPDGSTASATNTLVPAGKDGYVWRSVDRIVGDSIASPVEVKVIRVPPKPNS
jgi:uncharacterized protein (TIGR02246 family)